MDEKTEQIDYDALQKQAEEVRPAMITAGASAYPRMIDFPRLRQIADSVGAILFIDMAHIAGLVAGGQHPSPIPHAQFVTTTTHKSLRGPRGGIVLCQEQFAKEIDSTVFPRNSRRPAHARHRGESGLFSRSAAAAVPRLSAPGRHEREGARGRLAKHGYRIVSGGTDNHLMLVDLRPKEINGKEAQEVLDRAGITVNKNAIPFDTYPIFKPGGIHCKTLGTRSAARDRGLDCGRHSLPDLIAEALTRMATRSVGEEEVDSEESPTKSLRSSPKDRAWNA